MKKYANSDVTQFLEKVVYTAKGNDNWKVGYMTLAMKYDEFRRQGIEEGRQEVLVEGMQQNRTETAKKMLLNGKLSLDEISDITGLTKEQIQKLM